MQDPLFSREVSRVPVSLKQEKEKEQPMLAGSGQKCWRLLRLQSPDGSLRKMSMALLLGMKAWHSKQCVLVWRHKVTPFNRSLFQLAPSVRPTEGTGFGLLPTAQARDWKGQRATKNYNQPSIYDKIAMLG